jgi:hypothetical protein
MPCIRSMTGSIKLDRSSSTFYLDHPVPEDRTREEREGLQNKLNYRTAPDAGQTNVPQISPEIWSIFVAVSGFWTTYLHARRKAAPKLRRIVWPENCTPYWGCTPREPPPTSAPQCLIEEMLYPSDGPAHGQPHHFPNRKFTRRPVTGHRTVTSST